MCLYKFRRVSLLKESVYISLLTEFIFQDAVFVADS